MIQDRRFALAFRAGSLLFAIVGLMSHVGIFKGEFSSGAFMYYTIQSNLLAIVLFAALTVRTTKGLREGTKGSAGWYSRFGMIVAVDLLVTFIVFWTLLMPQGMSSDYLLSFDNIAVHAVTPLLCLFDYILFSKSRSLKYRDVYYACIFPICYTIFASIAGFVGYVYYVVITFDSPFSSSPSGTTPVRFPYFFLDFDKLGIMVLVYIGVILVFFLLLGHGIYFIDHKVRKP